MKIFFKLFLLFIISILFISCGQRFTKQFVFPEIQNGEKRPMNEIDGWKIEHPSMIAYKNVIDVTSIENPNTFWLTIYASHELIKDTPQISDLIIDTVEISFMDSDKSYLRFPTRVADYVSVNGKIRHIAFEFFNDQGLNIPENIISLKLSFKAKIVVMGDILEDDTMEYVLTRENKYSTVPLLQQ